MRKVLKSNKLSGVCYDIRGPVLKAAIQIEAEGGKVLKLNIGNPAPFGFDAPDDIVRDVIHNITDAEGYCDSKGIYPARVAIYQYYQQRKIKNLNIDNIFIGNGVSELIVMTMQALLNDGDEMLIPAPDYPLWTAAVNLSGGKAVHYLCDEMQNWAPDLADMEAKITAKTRGILLINPNNPTGAVYTKEQLLAVIELAKKHQLIIFSDEIYELIRYDNTPFINTAALSDEVMFVTFNGLSKTYRVAGYRTGWMAISGNTAIAQDYLDGLNILSSMRLCANVPTQFAIQSALGGKQSIYDLTDDQGRLNKQRILAHEMINDIPGLSTTLPQGALYCFVKIDTARFGINDDEKFILDLLIAKHILLVHGSAFNWPQPDHFRLVFLPEVTVLEDALQRLKDFLNTYQQ
ncbi:pyridoxal phosphate-dependent aminotransferase [Marinicella sp. S1101]|uniref:pyridoxal phosphate-dependent aminotransferase n=1 Tax=Marinicella marina TaxID=2996016 RepID=UPI0022609222|nr:pyridoxal phosphate-dependent aminotransferase [Marinicella marina]MCX7553737.1 pyridoxal phosphate-dependent aminotransferase [Marinicella marina]MDJ1140812.1 pyridoxal phosphate-dependent aminotransferase [Marinicella marina]